MHEKFVFQRNIQHFSHLLASADEAERAWLLRGLLNTERRALEAFERLNNQIALDSVDGALAATTDFAGAQEWAQPKTATQALPPAAPVHAASPGFPECARDCHLRSESDHRVANHLSMLSSYVRLKGADLGKQMSADDTSLQLFVPSVDAQIGAIGRLHRFMTTNGNDAPVDLAMLLHEVCAPFANGHSRRIAMIEDFAPGCMVAKDHVLPISQMVVEAIINANKYARPDGSAGEVMVRSRRDDGGDWIDVIDNGVGLPAPFDPDLDGGIGFHLMRSLSRGIGARLDFRSDAQGLCVSFALPRDTG